MRILLVDDHALFREALVHVLRQLDDDAAFVHAATAEEALAAANYYRDLDLILLDLSLPGGDGLLILGELRDVAITVPVVVVSASDDPRDVRRAMDAGASGYISQAAGTQEMIAALTRVLEGDIYVPSSLLAAMASLEKAGAPPRRQTGTPMLTERQLEVLRLLGQGLSNKGIANRLDLTEGTVKLHVSAVIRTLKARNRTEAVMAAERQGLLR